MTPKIEELNRQKNEIRRKLVDQMRELDAQIRAEEENLETVTWEETYTVTTTDSIPMLELNEYIRDVYEYDEEDIAQMDAAEKLELFLECRESQAASYASDVDGKWTMKWRQTFDS